MSSGNVERLARRMLTEVRSLKVPEAATITDAPSRIEFAAACGFTDLDPWQVQVLTSESRKQLLNCCRQSGKSTTTAIRALHQAAYVPDSLVLVLCPAQRQSGELVRKTTSMHASCGLPLPALVGDAAMRVELENGSRIIALPGSETTVRGYSAASMVIVDEASRVPDANLAAVTPSLATTNGPLIVLSTPRGKRGFFYKQWINALAWGWETTTITANDVPRISREFLEDERRRLGDFMYQQEYECQFLDEETSVFSSDLVEYALSGNFEPLWPLGSAAWTL